MLFQIPKYFSENGKINTSGGILTMQGLLKNKLCQSKTLISQHCTCLGYFHMEKSCLSGFGNYVAFALLEIPVGPSNSNSCTFHHSSFSVFLSFCFFYFISHLIAFQITKKKRFFQFTPPRFSLWMQWFYWFARIVYCCICHTKASLVTIFSQWWCQQSFQHWIGPSRMGTNT